MQLGGSQRLARRPCPFDVRPERGDLLLLLRVHEIAQQAAILAAPGFEPIEHILELRKLALGFLRRRSRLLGRLLRREQPPGWPAGRGRQQLGQALLHGLHDGGRAPPARHRADLARQHGLQRPPRRPARRIQHERLALLDPEKPQRAAGVGVGAAIGRAREAEQLLQLLLRLVAGRAHTWTFEHDLGFLQEALAHAPGLAADLERQPHRRRDLVAMRTEGHDTLALRAVALEQHGAQRVEHGRLARLVGLAHEVQPVVEAGEMDRLPELAEVLDLELAHPHQAAPRWAR